MNEDKIHANIHTISLKTNDIINKISINGIENVLTRDGLTTIKINVNKYKDKEITCYSEYITALNEILKQLGIKHYKIIRADLKLDSKNKDHYQKYAKINRYIISMIAVTYKVKNAYKSINLFSQKQVSVAVKNKYIEIENYDKEKQSNNTDIAKARLELRSKRLTDNDIKNEFTAKWFNRLNKSIENINAVYNRYNSELARIYKESKDVCKNNNEVEFRSLTDFLIQYKDCIFCKDQMIDLLTRLNIENPTVKAENHKKRYRIKYFSDNDAKRVISEIKNATNEFFDN